MVCICIIDVIETKYMIFGIWSMFEQGKYFFISLDVIFVELEVSSNNAMKKLDYKISHEKQQPFA